jgi:SAM-dependent methyltransferase
MLLRRTFVSTALAPLLPGQERKPGMFADAEAYERFMGRWSRMVAPQLADFAGLPAQGRFLDVGSGTGALAFVVAEQRPHAVVQGIDPSKEYVGYARSKNPVPSRVSFETGDAQALRFPEANFDASLSLLVFNFIPQPGKALSEVRRVTKQGGPIAAAVWDYGGAMRMLRVFWDAAVALDRTAEPADESHMPLCRSGELEALWKAGGLENVTGRPLEIQMQFASFSDSWDPFLLGQGPAGAYVRRIDATGRAALRAEVKRRLRLQSEDAPLSLPARAWAVRGLVPAGR